MSDQPFEKVMEVINPFVRVSRRLQPYPDPAVPNLMFKLLKDPTAYEVFVKDPKAEIERAGIRTTNVDVGMFTEVLRSLRDRLQGLPSPIDVVAETIESKETEEGMQYNFNNAESFLLKVENAIVYKRGNSAEKSAGEDRANYNQFKQSGIGLDWDSVLIHEINLIFFPSQPLVTPELVDRIKANLERR
jgi:hypothetical protein